MHLGITNAYMLGFQVVTEVGGRIIRGAVIAHELPVTVSVTKHQAGPSTPSRYG